MKLQEALELTALLPLGSVYEIRNSEGDRTIAVEGHHKNKESHVTFTAHEEDGSEVISQVEVKITHDVLFSQNWEVDIISKSGVVKYRDDLINFVINEISKDSEKRKSNIENEKEIISVNGKRILLLEQSCLKFKKEKE